MLASLSDWLYDGDPFAPLAWEKPLASVKARLASGEKVFENAIRRWFLENPHRVLVVVSPEEGLAEARQEAESSRLEALRGAMGPAEREGVEATAALLHEAQQRPDAPDARLLDQSASSPYADRFASRGLWNERSRYMIICCVGYTLFAFARSRDRDARSPST